MNENRRLFAALATGSTLYGTRTEGSDTDLVHLVYPTWEQLVSNKVTTFPQRFTEVADETFDIRTHLLGDFVMGLGRNPENMVLAQHYQDLFGAIQIHWLTAEAMQHILNVAENMWTHAKTPKNVAHAYRYAYAVGQWLTDPVSSPWPMLPEARHTYLAMRDTETPELAKQQVTKPFFDSTGTLRKWVDVDWKNTKQTDEDRKALAQWVMARYLGL